MKIKCMLDNTQYKKKPTGFEIGKIQNNMKQVEITIKQLANKLVEGCSFRPSFLVGKSEKDFVSMNLIALDFDEGTTIDNELNRCKELDILPAFGYTSFSHTEQQHKFRLVFALDKIVTDYNKAKQLQLIMMSLFDRCDKQCSNLSRLYFGGKELVYKGYGNRIDYKNILTRYNDVIYNKSLGVKGAPSINNIKDINYTRGTKNPLNIDTDINYNVQAIRDHNVKYLRSVLDISNDTTVFETQQEFFNYIFKINLAELLGIKYPRNFRCVFHDDKNPSANIFQDDETGNYIYKCHSARCGISYNIIGVCEVLGKFKTRPKTYEFIKELFNLEVMETEWQKQQKRVLIENIKALYSGELELNCPQTYKNIKRIVRYLQQMHIIALDNVYDDKLTDNNEDVTFFASRSYIAEKLNISPNNLSRISDRLVVLTYHNLINKLDDEEIPEKLLNKSKHINAINNNKNYKRINYFSIPSYTHNLYKDIEQQGIKWKDNNYTAKGTSREMFYRTEGKAVADKLYPQYKKITKKGKEVDRTTSIGSDKRTNEIISIILNEIDDKGYVTEKQIIEKLRHKYNKGFIHKQIKRSLTEILQTYNLERIRANKKIKESLGITDMKGYPFLIVKK